MNLNNSFGIILICASDLSPYHYNSIDCGVGGFMRLAKTAK